MINIHIRKRRKRFKSMQKVKQKKCQKRYLSENIRQKKVKKAYFKVRLKRRKFLKRTTLEVEKMNENINMVMR